MVYVISQSGKPLMPTSRHGKVRHLLREGKARVVRREPFTIQLLYDSKEYTQPVTLGVDAGTGHVGLSATTEKTELFAAEVTLRRDIQELMSTRREARRTRRSRKTRYRAPRFNNRRRKKGWLAPSVEQSVNSHLHLIRKVNSILPITKTIIEVAQFDQQKINNPDIKGVEYQMGPKYFFSNNREYVLWRDNHTCQCCHGKSKDRILNVHHIESRKTGGDSYKNLVTLCRTCHQAYHRGEVKLSIKRGQSLRDAALMNIMRWTVYNRAKQEFDSTHLTYGYITKVVRIDNNLVKSHAVDARCISGHPLAKPCDTVWQMRQVRKHTRTLHVMKHSKGGARRSAVASHWIGKTRLQRYDTVLWNGIKGFIAGSTNERPVLRNINWKLLTPTPSINSKNIKFLYRKKGSFLYAIS